MVACFLTQVTPADQSSIKTAAWRFCTAAEQKLLRSFYRSELSPRNEFILRAEDFF